MTSSYLDQLKDAAVKDSDRLCKIYTPFPLALGIASALADAPKAIWLEPSHGDGAFLHALAELDVPAARIRAIDLDPQPSSRDNLARTIRAVDFLEWSSVTTERFDRI